MERVEIGDAVLYWGDCLEVSDLGCVDAVVSDPPYGVTACKWDSVIPLDGLWRLLTEVTREDAAIVLMASQPFTSVLVSSNLAAFKYEWIWEKSRYTGFLQSKFMPMKAHENICVFCRMGKPTYNPQKTTGHVPTQSAKGYGHSPTFGASKVRDYKGGDTTRYPKTVQRFKNDRGFHPTQKPVALMEYLIRTYTNSGDTVLDFAMGSGTTGVAALNLDRRFIGIEKERKYFDIACERIEMAQSQGRLAL